MDRYYPMRRVPQATSSGVLMQFWRPLAGPFFRAALRSTVASLVFTSNPELRATLRERAREAGEEFSGACQRIYFDNPGLDSVTVRLLTRMGRDLAFLGARVLSVQVSLGLDRAGVARSNLEALPKTGYDALMTFGIAAGESLGYFRGGRTHVQLWWDSTEPYLRQKLPHGHPDPISRRFTPPSSLRDLAADIDDLYWANAYGQAIKVTVVGEGETRRWLVSLPGTDHDGLASEPNAADIEANLREELNMPNGMRAGTINTVRAAMALEGIDPKDMARERVLICGHSQGGMIAAGLASANPKDVGFTVDAILTMGSPTRRLRLRHDVVAMAVEHDQDIVPSLDGTPRRVADQRVVVGRSLNAPRKNPLFYAHSSSTYTTTVAQLERRIPVSSWGRESEVVKALQQYLPKEGERTRVFHYYTWQDVRDEADDRSWNEIFRVEEAGDWQPVRYEGEVEVPKEAAEPVSDKISGLVAALPFAPEKSGDGDHEQADG